MFVTVGSRIRRRQHTRWGTFLNVLTEERCARRRRARARDQRGSSAWPAPPRGGGTGRPALARWGRDRRGGSDRRPAGLERRARGRAARRRHGRGDPVRCARTTATPSSSCTSRSRWTRCGCASSPPAGRPVGSTSTTSSLRTTPGRRRWWRSSAVGSPAWRPPSCSPRTAPRSPSWSPTRTVAVAWAACCWSTSPPSAGATGSAASRPRSSATTTACCASSARPGSRPPARRWPARWRSSCVRTPPARPWRPPTGVSGGPQRGPSARCSTRPAWRSSAYDARRAASATACSRRSAARPTPGRST